MPLRTGEARNLSRDGPWAAEAIRLAASRRLNWSVALIKAQLFCRDPRVLTRKPRYAGAGGARSPVISDRMSVNIWRDTATSASWKVT